MRLLNVNTLEFQEFFGGDIPSYCILSHRWGETEISYKDYLKGRYNAEAAGYRKIINFCHAVKSRAVPAANYDILSIGKRPVCQWVWVDTICIDKRSSSELSEAINSMYRWYIEAEECYVCLNDVPSDCSKEETLRVLTKSSWFTRGFTLQELLAPSLVVLFNVSWEVIGHLCDAEYYDIPCDHNATYGPLLSAEISRITGISVSNLANFKPERASIAQRMSWASKRKTSRVEDQAYCLLGIFDVNMPLIFGEGQRAFLRLQEEIIKRSSDQSIFAWTDFRCDSIDAYPLPLLARSPAWFNNSGEVTWRSEENEQPYQITNRGLQWQPKTIAIQQSHILRDYCLGSEWTSTDRAPMIRFLKLNCRAPTSSNDLDGTRCSVVIALRAEQVANKPMLYYRVLAKDFGQNFGRRFSLQKKSGAEAALLYLAI